MEKKKNQCDTCRHRMHQLFDDCGQLKFVKDKNGNVEEMLCPFWEPCEEEKKEKEK